MIYFRLQQKEEKMLKKIEITNFKNFNKKFTFDLSDTNNFEFNKECIHNGIVNTGIIYLICRRIIVFNMVIITK